MSDYPEHDKLHKVATLSQACGEFVDWLAEHHIHLAEYVTFPCSWCEARGHDLKFCLADHPDDERADPRLFLILRPLHDLLAEHFQIDPVKLEAEKRRLLASARSAARSRR